MRAGLVALRAELLAEVTSHVSICGREVECECNLATFNACPSVWLGCARIGHEFR